MGDSDDRTEMHDPASHETATAWMPSLAHDPFFFFFFAVPLLFVEGMARRGAEYRGLWEGMEKRARARPQRFLLGTSPVEEQLALAGRFVHAFWAFRLPGRASTPLLLAASLTDVRS